MNTQTPHSSSRELYRELTQELWIFSFLVLVLIAFLLFCFWLYKQKLKKKAKFELESLKEKISCDLHDEIGVNLAGISLMTEGLKKKYANEEELHEYLDEIRHAASETDIATQEIVALLENNENFKLDEYILKIFDRYCSSYQSKIEIEPNIHFEKFSVDQRRHLLLFFKEALHNILRHSQAKKINLEMRWVDEMLFFKIKDDGIGFDNRDSGKLKKLKQRSEKLNCDLKVHSVLNEGVELLLKMKRE